MTKGYSRRKVVGWMGAGTALAIGGASVVWHGINTVPAVSQGWTPKFPGAEASGGGGRLALVRNGDPAAMVDAAMDALGGMGRFVSRGATVLVKPNIGWDRAPELAANTNPELVARVVELCLAAGAASVIVMDRPCNDPRRSYTNSGIQAAATAAGASVLHADDERIRTTNLAGEVLSQWGVYREMMDVDVRINLPVAKHHRLARVTLGMKNWMGCVSGRRGVMHQHINKAVVDLAAFFRPQLTILDAYRVLVANGPSGGDVADVRKIATLCAGADPVAVDTFGASLFQYGPDDISYLRMAEERGLGSRDLSSVGVTELDLSAAG